MWQAYYAKENVRLFGLLVTTLREQYHYSWLTATKEGYHLARAAATFGNARSNYEQVLPDLEAGYLTAKRLAARGVRPASGGGSRARLVGRTEDARVGQRPAGRERDGGCLCALV